jgi:hypothetical protein
MVGDSESVAVHRLKTICGCMKAELSFLVELEVRECGHPGLGAGTEMLEGTATVRANQIEANLDRTLGDTVALVVQDGDLHVGRDLLALLGI